MRRSAWRTRDGRRARAAGACALAALTASCLVTDRPEFGEPNVPAHLTPLAPADFTRVPDRPDQAACGTSGIVTESTGDITPWMAFSVALSDQNIEDRLQARLVINGTEEIATNSIPPTGEVERGPLVLCAKRRGFSARCNRVEILVSSDFSITNEPYATEIPGDLARWQWWVLAPSADDPLARPSDCEQQLSDAGVP